MCAGLRVCETLRRTPARPWKLRAKNLANLDDADYTVDGNDGVPYGRTVP
jgi:hypothetical protein